MKPRWRIVAGLLLIQVLGSWGARIVSSYRSKSSYSYRSVNYDGSNIDYDSSYIGDMPFPQWARNQKGAAALFIFYNLTDKGPPYRVTYTALTGGRYCVNKQGFDVDNVTVSMGWFQCPVDGFMPDDLHCCGPDPYQYCCHLMDDPVRKGLIIAIPILAFIVILISISVIIRACCKKQAKFQVSASSTDVSSAPSPVQIAMGPVTGTGFASSQDPSVPPPPPPPQKPYIDDPALRHPNAPPPPLPPLRYAPVGPMHPPSGAEPNGSSYSSASPPPSAYQRADSASPTDDEASRASPHTRLFVLPPRRIIDDQ